MGNCLTPFIWKMAAKTVFALLVPVQLIGKHLLLLPVNWDAKSYSFCCLQMISFSGFSKRFWIDTTRFSKMLKRTS